jgi:hypothetical protein
MAALRFCVRRPAEVFVPGHSEGTDACVKGPVRRIDAILHKRFRGSMEVLAVGAVVTNWAIYFKFMLRLAAHLMLLATRPCFSRQPRGACRCFDIVNIGGTP